MRSGQNKMEIKIFKRLDNKREIKKKTLKSKLKQCNKTGI